MIQKETQHQEILKALRNGEQVSTWWGFQRGNSKVTTRISELRDMGYQITDEWKEYNGKRFKVYSLIEEEVSA